MKIPQVFTLIQIILLAEILFVQSKSTANKHVFNDKNVLMCFYGFGGK